MQRCRLILLTTTILGACVGQVEGDALVVTQAMKASTIAEFFIEPKSLRVDLEIGSADFAAFPNLLLADTQRSPTDTDNQSPDQPTAFFEREFVIRAGDDVLQGKVTSIRRALREMRDLVTGDILPQQPADREAVFRVTVEYDLPDAPTTISLQPPMDGEHPAATIGFILYHRGVPVNDFRYLPANATVDLDWDDPWYSKFRHRNLRRQFDAPLSAFLYIEPFEVRKEIILRPKDLAFWSDIQIGDDVISVEQQEDLKRDVAEFLQQKNPVRIDGRSVTGKLDRISFVYRNLRTTGVLEPAAPVDAATATLGVIFVYPVNELPNEVTMTWELFSPKIESIPAASSDEAGGLPTVLTADAPDLIWRNYLTNPTGYTLMTVPPTPNRGVFRVPAVTISAILIAILLAVRSRGKGTDQRRQRLYQRASLVAVFLGVLALPIARISIASPFRASPALTDDEASDVMLSLLYNTYRAFDHHDDVLIYDRLSQSVSGELLNEVFLETRRSTEVKNQGGLRVSVKNVTIHDIKQSSRDGDANTYDLQWQVDGSIGHWGHIHQRANIHRANITIAPRDGVWKITGLETLETEPITSTGLGR